MVLATERIDESHQSHEVLHAKVSAWGSGWCIVIKCDCGERFVLTDANTVGDRGADRSTTAKEGFYSWLEDYPARLGAKRRVGNTTHG